MLSSAVLAHDDVDEGVKLKSRAMSVIIISSILVTALVILAIISKQKLRNHKKMLFSLMLIPIIVATIYTAGTTIYLNHISVTSGPVHWHADFEIWNCGEKLDVLDPHGLSNRIGTPVFHHHNDLRMHVEGVVLDLADVTLKHFFEVLRGNLDEISLTVLTDKGLVRMQEGDLCHGSAGKVQIFVYETTNPEEQENWIYAQRKIDDIFYVLSPYSQVPPGDCIIIEFDQEKEKTDKICTTYQAAIEQGELHGG